MKPCPDALNLGVKNLIVYLHRLIRVKKKHSEHIWLVYAGLCWFMLVYSGLCWDVHRKNIAQIIQGTVDSCDRQIRHFLTDSPWSELAMNEERLDIMMSRRQTKFGKNCTIILDDSGHRKSGHETDGVGRKYIGEIGKTDQGMSMVTVNLYDGVRNIPLDSGKPTETNNFSLLGLLNKIQEITELLRAVLVWLCWQFQCLIRCWQSNCW